MRRASSLLFKTCLLGVSAGVTLMLYSQISRILQDNLFNQHQKIVSTMQTTDTADPVNLIDEGDEQEARRKLICDVCVQTQYKGDFLSPIFQDPYHNLSFCLINKAGSTFILRWFRFVTKQRILRKGIKDPFDMSRMDAQTQALDDGTLLKPEDENFWDVVSKSTRITFSRDPYTRLYSAYLDKFFLAEFVERFKDDLTKITKPENECDLITNISFANFVDMMLEGSSDQHWTPMYNKCNPCVFRPDFIGRMETFKKDVSHVISLTKSEQYFEAYDHIKDEVNIIIRFHFTFYSRSSKLLKKCSNYLEVAEKLWRYFQLSGLIEETDIYPKEEIIKFLESTILMRHNLLNTASSVLKRRMLVNAYKTISPETLLKVAYYYDLDFKLYGYEKFPSDIFVK